MTYSEKLRDPRWQAKRLEIMQRANMRCEMCRDHEQELHVHHKHYSPGRDPWDYPASNLVCLCADCHDMHHKPQHKVMAYVLATNGEIRAAVNSLVPLLKQKADLRGFRAKFKGAAFLAMFKEADARIAQFETDFAALLDAAGDDISKILGGSKL